MRKTRILICRRKVISAISLQCAGLIHDIGNPPFGHFGEEAIRDWFMKNLSRVRLSGVPVPDYLSDQMLQDLYHFEGNAQALRLVSKLHFLVNEYGMNLTYALLNTIIKYPVSSTRMKPGSGNIRDKKMGYFYAEQQLYQDIAAGTTAAGVRHPLTFILEAADDIAYRTADIEDAFKRGVYPIGNFFRRSVTFRKSMRRARKAWMPSGFFSISMTMPSGAGSKTRSSTVSRTGWFACRVR